MSLVTETDASTGETITRNYTADEAAQRKADEAADAAAQAERDAKQANAESARRKIAEASGLTPEEMAALGF